MIFEDIADLVAGFLVWVAGLFDLPAVPSVVGDIPGYVSAAGAYMTGTGAWVPWPLVTTMLGLWAAALVAGLVIRVVRIVASFMTAGGGGAA